MTSGIKKARNLNRAQRGARAALEKRGHSNNIFDTHWDELVIAFDKSSGQYVIRTMRQSKPK